MLGEPAGRADVGHQFCSRSPLTPAGVYDSPSRDGSSAAGLAADLAAFMADAQVPWSVGALWELPVRVLVTARHIAMYLCRELTDLSLPKIGQQFGGRDATTVINADRKIRSLMAERRSIYTQVTELTNRIMQQARSE